MKIKFCKIYWLLKITRILLLRHLISGGEFSYWHSHYIFFFFKFISTYFGFWWRIYQWQSRLFLKQCIYHTSISVILYAFKTVRASLISLKIITCWQTTIRFIKYPNISIRNIDNGIFHWNMRKRDSTTLPRIRPR